MDDFINIKKKKFNLYKSVEEIPFQKMPEPDEEYKLISAGGFSVASIVLYCAEIQEIDKLYISTLRVGKKELRALVEAAEEGMIKKVKILCGSIMKKDSVVGKSYGYWDELSKTCKNQKWGLKIANNHSKVVLMQCGKDYYVIETSSNFNENPKMEQFSICNDKKLFDFYKDAIFLIGGDING